MRLLALTPALAALLLAGPAAAGPVITLNGVGIDGATDQRFENATVVIDAAGNVHITARGYAVKGEPAAPPVVSGAPRGGVPAPALAAATTAAPPASPPPVAAPAPPAGAAPAAAPAPRLTRRYFVATEQTQPDGTQYDVEVFVNASWIRVLRSADPPWVGEITRFLRPGTNKVTLAATKKLAGVERRYYTKDVTLRVVVGEGNVGGDHVMIDEPLVLMTRTAAEVDDRTEEFTVEAR
jgi:hypothetical protein